tara:strand:- start:2140 stop:3750 length:1611 start_codon:yes stop_codon:yes gene_type:complete
MAVTFNPVGEATEGGLVIGGSGDAPFPKYSVSTERVEAGDGTIIDIIYTISVTGQVIAVGDMTAVGVRQNSLHTAMIAKLAALENDGPVGILEIVAYGGSGSSPLVFDDAKLTGISFDEQDDESAGTQVGGYTFEFTAHTRSSTKTGSAYTLASAEESWDITENAERYFVDNEFTTTTTTTADPPVTTTTENFAAKTYTITHTVSAVGYNKITAVEGKEFDSGWAQAKDWVLGRLVTTPATAITDNVAGNNRFTEFSALYMGEKLGPLVGDGEGNDPPTYLPRDPVFIDLSSDSAYNHSRTAQSDLPGGSYSVTETWYMSEEAVTLDVDLALDTGEDGVTNITVSGGIQGYNTYSFATRTEDKIKQAEEALSAVLDQAYGLANIFYKASVPESTTACPAALGTSEMSKSISKNKITGAITYSLSYNDRGSESLNTITENLQITDDNEDQSNSVVAIIQIIGRANGPIFQSMGTTTERKRSASLEWTMKRCNRTNKPSSDAILVVNAHKPVGAYQLSKSESWTPSTGGYSLSIEWTY